VVEATKRMPKVKTNSIPFTDFRDDNEQPS
jgi:hypothetical protein